MNPFGGLMGGGGGTFSDINWDNPGKMGQVGVEKKHLHNSSIPMYNPPTKSNKGNSPLEVS